MKIFVLVLALASIGQTQLGQEGKEQKEKSQLRLGYGIMYEHWGKLLHSLNVYDLIVAIDLPSIDFKNPIGEVLSQFDKHCEDINEQYTDLIEICYYVWPLYYHYREQEYDYQTRIQTQLTQNIPRILPGFEPPKVEVETLPKLPEIDPLKRLTQMQFDHLRKLHGQGLTQEHINQFVRNLGIFQHMMDMLQDEQAPVRNTREVPTRKTEQTTRSTSTWTVSS